MSWSDISVNHSVFGGLQVPKSIGYDWFFPYLIYLLVFYFVCGKEECCPFVCLPVWLYIRMNVLLPICISLDFMKTILQLQTISLFAVDLFLHNANNDTRCLGNSSSSMSCYVFFMYLCPTVLIVTQVFHCRAQHSNGCLQFVANHEACKRTGRLSVCLPYHLNERPCPSVYCMFIVNT